MKAFVVLALFALLTPIRVGAQEPAPEKSRQIAVNVFGEVKQPGRYLLPKGATVLDALGAAGGQNPEADLKRVRSIHASVGDKPLADKIDVKAVLDGKAVAPTIHDGDSLTVPRRFITYQY